MNLEVELRPHIGQQFIPGLGEVNVEHDQYMIYIVGDDYTKATGIKELHAGYVCKSPVNNCPRTGISVKNPINWLPAINQWPPAIVDKLSQSVQNALAVVHGASQADKDLVASGETRPVNLAPDLSKVEVSDARLSTDSADAAGSADNL